VSFPCLILAAGFGTRMGALTRHRPKALIEVAGRPLIAHALDAARAAGAGPIAVNGHYRAEALEAWLSSYAPDVQFLNETPEILDSGGAVKNALPVLGEGPVFTLNADAVWDGSAPLVGLARAWDPDRMDGLVALVRREAAVGRQDGGDFSCDAAGRIGWDKGPDGLVYVGAQILKTEDIATHPGRFFSLVEIWNAMMDQDRLIGHLHEGRWADVGHPAGIAEAEMMVGHDTSL
jgi:MurNAc alpha-1-phosphate uridylyltransferase